MLAASGRLWTAQQAALDGQPPSSHMLLIFAVFSTFDHLLAVFKRCGDSWEVVHLHRAGRAYDPHEVEILELRDGTMLYWALQTVGRGTVYLHERRRCFTLRQSVAHEVLDVLLKRQGGDERVAVSLLTTYQASRWSCPVALTYSYSATSLQSGPRSWTGTLPLRWNGDRTAFKPDFSGKVTETRWRYLEEDPF
jgi:hypothetical protein